MNALPSTAPNQLLPQNELLKRFDIPGPRYTSYPTADRFVEAFNSTDYGIALQQLQTSAVARKRPISLYIHIPFCAQLCYYCGCNKIITRHAERADEYLNFLSMEAALIAQKIHAQPQSNNAPQNREASAQANSITKPLVSQLHLGGGSPTFLSDAQLTRLMEIVSEHFAITADAECSIEIDPRTVTPDRLQKLYELGFNRLSFGVQDFDAEVQKSVHREQSTEQVFALLKAARSIGFSSINVDLIYGLPKQTRESFAQTLVLMQELRPDRIALYAYAHLPERFKPQRRISQADLPCAAEKVQMLQQAQTAFEQAGYIDIGMDHFALAQDSLAIAKKQGRLHRNFQGYSTQADTDLIGLGVSSISKVGATYSQNDRTLETYYDRLKQGQLPVMHGLALNRDDLARRSVIMALMCQGSVIFESIETANLLNFKQYFRAEIERLREFEAFGLVSISEASIDVTELGWTYIRAIAMVFDKYLQTDRSRARFSKIL